MLWKSAIAGLLLGLAYSILYFFLALGASGAGHGTFIFFAPISLYGLGLIVFPVLGFLAGNLRPFLSKVLFVAILVIHYTGVINSLRPDWMREPAYIQKSWDASAWNVILPALVYLGGQLLLWGLFIRSIITGRRDATEQIVGPERREPIAVVSNE